MKQVININFQGRVVPIEVTAFDTLKAYTESLHKYFAGEEGRDEIINDIESRIAELFQERLKAGATCITDSDVEAIIKSIGRPEDFEEADGGASTGSEQKKTDTKSSSQAEQPKTAPGTHKRLYRDENNKVLGGVCSGIANYFGMDPVIIRIIFVVLLFAGGIGFLPYIIFWIAVPSSATTVIGGSRKKFFRDPDDKIVAGVCSGISNYFGINAWIPRVLFLLPFISIAFRWGHWGFYDFPSFLNFSVSPGSLIIYIILWLVIPEATTTAEKLEMKGEKVDMNSIKNSVMEEMKGVGQRVEKFGEEAKEFATDKSKVMGAEMSRVVKRTGTSLGDIIAFIAKVFAYFIIGVVGISLIAALFGLSIAAIGLFPLKDYVLTSGWQNAFAWGTLLFFIAVPVIGIITWIIRRIAKVKGNSKMVRWTFSSLWVLGWISVICLISSVARDFKSFSRDNSQPVFLSNPGVSKLELTTSMPNERRYNNRWMRFEPFQGLSDGDTVYVQNVQVVIEKSLTDSFSVNMERYANGNTRDYADTAARMIQYYAVQKDTVLLLDKGIPITQKDKFRNQHVVLRVYVPVGKKIKINRNIGWGNEVHFSGPYNNRRNWHIDWDDERDYSQNWDFNVEYTMTAEGLQTKDGKYLKDKNTWSKTERYRNRTTTTTVSDDDNYRYDNSDPVINKIDSARQKAMKEEQRVKDSLEKVKEDADKMKEKADKLLEKLNNKTDNNEEEPEALISNYVPLKDVSVKIM
jgi:phage shock protein PspC (stress-responsive transcriptional regulator)